MKKIVFLILWSLLLSNIVYARCLDCTPPPDVPPSFGPKDVIALSGGAEGNIGSVVNVPAGNLPNVVPPAVSNFLEEMIPMVPL